MSPKEGLLGQQDLAQFRFQDLAVVVLGKAFGKTVAFRALETGNVVLKTKDALSRPNPCCATGPRKLKLT